MNNVTVDSVLELAQQLDPSQRLLVAMRLEASIPNEARNLALRRALQTDLAQQRAQGVFAHTESLYGKYAIPGVEWEEDELDSYLREVGKAWEQELDELVDDDNTRTSDSDV